MDKKIFKVLALLSFSDAAAIKVLHGTKLFEKKRTTLGTFLQNIFKFGSFVKEEKSFSGKCE